MLLEVKDIVKVYAGSSSKDKIYALDKISFNVDKKEILGIIGPNGAGKTTLLHILLGLITPTEGSISILGYNGLTQMNEVRQHINFSSTYLSLPFSLTVCENLRVAAGLYGITEHKKRIDELLEMMKMRHMENNLTKGLSAGELARLLLARSLLNDPEILFLDEPTASLDPLFADNVRKMLKQIQQQRKCTVIFSSHNMSEIEELADNVIFINKGKIVTKGKPKELLRKYKKKNLENLFISLAEKF